MKIKNVLHSKSLTPYLFLAPFFIIFSIFMLYPILNSLFLSFTSAQGNTYNFIGLSNFKRVLADKNFLEIYNECISYIGSTGPYYVIYRDCSCKYSQQ